MNVTTENHKSKQLIKNLPRRSFTFCSLSPAQSETSLQPRKLANRLMPELKMKIKAPI